MYPELFEIPFIHWPVPSYGLMMVVGFLSALFLIRRLARPVITDPRLITNAALYSLTAGVIGARLFYVLHYFNHFRQRPLAVFAIWQGGLELLGGVILATAVILFYLRHHKLPVRRCLDILAVGLMLALAIGRIGCFLNGCCFGKPTNLPWAVRFPYHSPLHLHSPAYRSQVYPDLSRNRTKPHLQLPAEFLGYLDDNGLPNPGLKPYEHLTDKQKQAVDSGRYRCLPVHPTQLYSSANAAILCLILYLFWRRSQKTARLLFRPGCTFSLMFVLYGISRFFIEFLRDDNPFGFLDLTISQNISIALIALGAALMAIFASIKPLYSRPSQTAHR